MNIGYSLAMAVALLSCNPPAGPKYPAYCSNEKLFTAKLVECPLVEKDRAASRACRAKVHEACGIVLTSSTTWGTP